MRKLLIVFSLGFALYACNDEAGTHTDHSDTTSHETGHNKGMGQEHMKEMHDAMSGLEEKVKSYDPSGDPDYDFAMIMKEHHLAAIQMGKSEMMGGSDGKMKRMAQKIVDEQEMDRVELDRAIQAGKSGANSDFGQKAKTMITEMSSIKMESGSLDAMFASMMMPHHQDAIKMSEEFIKVGKNEDLLRIARKIISTHPAEISEFQEWLDKNKNK